jgi:N-acetylneuraminate synthase
MIWSKRPGTGIPAKKMKEVLGKKAIRDIPKDTLISWDDIR